jgi:20S proteasome alpha/beta subunit
MTIAAGFHCADGIVLAVDSQYGDGVSKTSGQKIFSICQTERYSVTLAGAGHVGMTKRAVSKFTSLLHEKVSEEATTIVELQSILEDALCEVHTKHIYSAPADERVVLDFWLLVAAWTPSSGSVLFRTDVTAANLIHGSDCIGVGLYLGKYLIDLLCAYSPTMYVEDVKPIAAYIIKCAKENVDGCGLHTFVRVLTSNGIDERVQKEEIIDAETYFESLFSSLRLFTRGALNVNVPPNDPGVLSESFRIAADQFRKKQAKRIEAREARRKEIAGQSCERKAPKKQER